jgi:hypothetical protein
MRTTFPPCPDCGTPRLHAPSSACPVMAYARLPEWRRRRLEDVRRFGYVAVSASATASVAP